MDSFDKIALYILCMLNLLGLGFAIWGSLQISKQVTFILDAMIKDKENIIKKAIKSKA